MTKRILTAIAVITFGLMNAQDVKFGTKAGLNISNLRGDIHQTKNKTGFHVGGFAEIKLDDDFSIQPEILYSTQGTKSQQNYYGYDGSFKVDLTQDLSYLNVPIMVKFYLVEKFYIEAGPQVGFLLNAEQSADANGMIYGEAFHESITVDNKKDLNSTDFSVNFGLGINLTKKIGAGVRYSLGVSDIDKEDKKSEISNSNIGISILYCL